MTSSRATQVDLESTPYYHCISRCVRRAFLCGYDDYSKRDFDHRKRWLVDRMKVLAEAFAVDLCAYAVMSNHFHVVLRVDRERALAWDEQEVLARYAVLFKNARRELEALHPEVRAERVALYRVRLHDLSWYMRTLNEHIARRANHEDECSGRFWEGRFKSQPLLDEAALLTCMSYVDLNPVRAGVSQGLADSDFTSIQERLVAACDRFDREENAGAESGATPHELVPFSDEPGEGAPLPMTLADYASLLDWTGRAARPGGRALSGPVPVLLERRGIDPEAWLRTMRGSGLQYLATLGTRATLTEHAARRGKRWVRGQGWARGLFADDAVCTSFCASV